MLGHRSRSDCFKHWIIVCLPLYNKHTWISLVHLYSKDHITFVFNVVCLFFFVPLENFLLIWRRHHCRWRAANFDLCSALMAMIREGSLACHTYCDTGHPSPRTHDNNTYCQVFSACMAYALTHCATAPAVNNQVTSNLHELCLRFKMKGLKIFGLHEENIYYSQFLRGIKQWEFLVVTWIIRHF